MTVLDRIVLACVLVGRDSPSTPFHLNPFDCWGTKSTGPVQPSYSYIHTLTDKLEIL